MSEALLAGRYRLVSVIATGGMGVVWEAWDERLERPVAVKQLRALPGVPEAEAELAKERAMREARITARLHHRHAVPVFDAVEHEGQPCLVMQLLVSTPLSAVLRESGCMPLGQAARIGKEIASALAAAHRLGIVHRDVKPGNILITADGAAHISDFGISHAMGDATLTHTGMIHGTPAYLAPEVARGEDASFPADVFSLGSTLYAAIEGAPPFGSDGNSLALLHKVAAARVPPPTRAGELTPFLLDMLSAQPESRPTMEAVAISLAEFTAEVEPVEEPVTVPHTAPPGSTGPHHEAGVGSTAELEPEATQETDPPTTQSSPQTPAPALAWFFPEEQGPPARVETEGAGQVPESMDMGAEPGIKPEVVPEPRGDERSDPEAERDHRRAGDRQRHATQDGRDEGADNALPAAMPRKGQDPSAGPPGRAGGPLREAFAAPAGSKRAPGPERRRRSSRAAVLVGSAVVVALVLLMAATLTDNLRRDQVEAGRGSTVQATPTTEPSAPEQSPDTTAATTTARQAEPEPAPPASQTEPEPDQTPEPTGDPASPERAAQLTSAITNYYALLPNNTAEAWPRMTADYQANHAGGMSAYEDFWNNIDDVSMSDVGATPPDRVVATLTYSYNGRVDVERTSFRLVDEGGILKIAASEVLSSRSG